MEAALGGLGDAQGGWKGSKVHAKKSAVAVIGRVRCPPRAQTAKAARPAHGAVSLP